MRGEQRLLWQCFLLNKAGLGIWKEISRCSYTQKRENDPWGMAVCAHLCLTLCDPMDCSPPGSFVHPGKNDGMGCRFLIQGAILTQGSNLCLLQWQAGSSPLSRRGGPYQWWLLYRLSSGGQLTWLSLSIDPFSPRESWVGFQWLLFLECRAHGGKEAGIHEAIRSISLGTSYVGLTNSRTHRSLFWAKVLHLWWRLQREQDEVV